jgi:hypothetical protein
MLRGNPTDEFLLDIGFKERASFASCPSADALHFSTEIARRFRYRVKIG